MAEKKSDEEILFPEVDVEGITIRPWTFGQLLEVNPYIEAIFVSLEQRGMTFDFTLIGLKEIKDIYFAAAPQLLKILEVSTGKSEEEIKKLSIATAIKVLHTIWRQNGEVLKNVSSLIGLTAAAETEKPNDEQLSGDQKKEETSA